MKKILAAAVVSIILLAVGLTVLRMQGPEVPSYLNTTGGDFTVQTTHGSLTLSGLKGNVVLLYFGYSHCPDVCPATLNVMASGIRLLDEDDQKQVQGLFVSLDPARDSPDKLQSYTAFFSPKIIGATAQRATLDDIAKQWRFSYHTPEHPKTKFYVVQHPNFLYVVNKDGHVVALLDGKSTPEDVAKVVRLWL